MSAPDLVGVWGQVKLYSVPVSSPRQGSAALVFRSGVAWERGPGPGPAAAGRRAAGWDWGALSVGALVTGCAWYLQVELEMAIDTLNPNYCRSKGEQIALNVDGTCADETSTYSS